MLLSRFWYLILSFALAAAAGILFVAHGFYNRHTERWMNEALMADASAVAWYLKDDARSRAAALVPVALAPDLREPLAKASESDEITPALREKAKQALTNWRRPQRLQAKHQSASWRCRRGRQPRASVASDARFAAAEHRRSRGASRDVITRHSAG